MSSTGRLVAIGQDEGGWRGGTDKKTEGREYFGAISATSVVAPADRGGPPDCHARRLRIQSRSEDTRQRQWADVKCCYCCQAGVKCGGWVGGGGGLARDRTFFMFSLFRAWKTGRILTIMSFGDRKWHVLQGFRREREKKTTSSEWSLVWNQSEVFLLVFSLFRHKLVTPAGMKPGGNRLLSI